MSDLRAWPSESYAFTQLGFSDIHIIKSEQELMSEFCGAVPEAIFRDPHTEKNVSIEVKRIVGNDLPKGDGRRFIRRRKSIIWPWTSTVESALGKVNGHIICTYMVQEHHIVFIVPESLSQKSFERLKYHVDTTVNERISTVADLKPKRIHTHVIRGPLYLFDRF